MTDLVKIFVYMVATFGISEMVVFARGPFGIFERWREIAHDISDGFGELFTCMLCFPTWLGLALSLVNVLLVPVAFTPFTVVLGLGNGFWMSLLTVLLDMGFTAGSTWFANRMEDALDRHFNITGGEEEEA